MLRYLTISRHKKPGGIKIAARFLAVRKIAAAVRFGVMTICIALTLLALPAFGSPPTPLSSEGALEVTVKAGRLSIKAYQVALAVLLNEIGIRTGIKIETGNPQGALGEKVNLTVVDASIEDVLKRLSTNRAFVYEFNPEKNEYILTAAGVFQEGVRAARGHGAPGHGGQARLGQVLCPYPRDQPEEAGPPAAHLRQPGGL